LCTRLSVQRQLSAAVLLYALLGVALPSVCQAQEGQKPTAPKPGVEVVGDQGGAPAQAAGEPAEKPGFVTNVFFDEDIRQALSDMATQAKVTIIPDDTVQGTVTVELEDVPIEDALRRVLLGGGYVYKKIDEVYLVGAPDPESPSFRLLAETQVVDLDYATTAEIEALLPAYMTKFIKTEAGSGRLSVSAPQPILDDVVAAVRSLDRPNIQVMIEVLVVETAKTALDDLMFSATTSHFSYDTAQGTINYFSLAQSALGALKALLTSDKAVLRASPRVVAQEGKEATIEVGTEEYFAIVTGPVNFPYTTLEQVKATISLKITPRVSAEKKDITVALEPEVSDVVGQGATGLPIVTVRRAKTEITVGDGQVILIGGLLQNVEKKSRKRIPFFSEIPLIGHLFTSHEKKKVDTETVIFIAPHLLDENGEFSGPLLIDSVRPESTSQTSSGGAQSAVAVQHSGGLVSQVGPQGYSMQGSALRRRPRPLRLRGR